MFLQFQQNMLQYEIKQLNREIINKKLQRIVRDSYNISQNKQLSLDMYTFLMSFRRFQEHRIQTWKKQYFVDLTQKGITRITKQSISEVYEKFKKTFPRLNGKELNTDMMLKISSFSTYLSKSTKQLESLKEQVKLLAATKKQYTDQQNQNAQTNNFDYLVDLLRIECREVEAFQETLKQKEFIDNLKASTSQKLKDQSSELAKLQAGKTTLKSIFSKGSSTEQAQIQEKKYQKLRINLIHQTQNEIKLLDELCMMISSILCLDEIDRFKKNKQNKYYESLIKVSQLGQQLNELYIKFWSEVSKGTKAEVVV